MPGSISRRNWWTTQWTISTAFFDVNVRGLFLYLREEINLMQRTGGGSTVSVGSVAGQGPFPGNSLCNASKAAAKMLTAGKVLFLGSTKAVNITGASLALDDGFVIG